MEKLEPVLGEVIRHGGSYVDTPVAFHAHTDTGKLEEMENRYAPYKNVLIPLSESCGETPFSTVFFKQRHFGQAAHLWRGKDFENETPLYNFKMTEYDSLFENTGLPFNKEHHELYLNHLPIESLFSLSLGRVIDWCVGDLILFDCSQIHASRSLGDQDQVKSSLTMFTSKLINEK